MKIRFGKLLWKIALILAAVGIVAVLAGIIYALPLSRPNYAAQKAVAETRQSLRQRGFKTDLADFNFSSTPEEQACEAVLKNTTLPPGPRQSPLVPNLQQIVGGNSAIVVWRLDSPEPVLRASYYSNDPLSWEGFRANVGEYQDSVDAACGAVLSGRIQFNLDASRGSSMLLPHLAIMKNLTQTFGNRTVLALHVGDPNVAWTNLMAATRLVTAWQPEPAEISHLVRFVDTSLTLGTVWQALQTNHWPDDRLLRLQHEWESVDFFTNLPEVMAFNRASRVAQCQQDRVAWHSRPYPGGSFVSAIFHSPIGVWQELTYHASQQQYYVSGTYEDEKALLLFYRDRELELRNAIKAPTWMQMRQLPGVTNRISFQSPYRSRMQTLLNMHEISLRLQREDDSLLGRAAVAEAQRRLIITALALERYRGKYGAYPNSPTQLAPEFLKALLSDFMDGQPLRYRLTDDGDFLLYSVGLDCADDGGKAVIPLRPNPAGIPREARNAPVRGDILWPLPAGTAALQEELQRQAEQRQREDRAEQLRYYRERQQESAEDWKQSPLRQSRVPQILATKWSPAIDSAFFDGHPAAELLRNANSATNQVSLAELMTPRQVLTGHEPEDLTFEFPISYDAITNHGFFLLLDAETNADAMFAPDSGADVQERSRAPNGDCLLIWHTIFDPPGKHALQAELTWYNNRGAETWTRGPAIALTTSNLCQFSLDSAIYDVDLGATFHARLPEKNGTFSIECVTTNGAHLTTLTGSTTNGEFKTIWNLVDDHGQRLTGETFNSIVHITLPDSGRTQTLRGP